ncbi:response regulator transcription factor [Microlunatus parietis]|uniref:Two-component system response regulator DesR n=1 Tax=Microlunatus parietis TaxID=682979 RepID=A0A7Y9I4K5_9ACTN|nr:response regulator transcription factor [Microlunatus parietis]NYE70162.1 two-component system response regulator DesR [Microlunatus parietis]
MIKLLLADDEALIRDAVATLLDFEPDLSVVAVASDGRQAVQAALDHRPDVAVVDLDMPKLDGMAVSTELGRALPSCRVIILTGRGRPAHLRRALRAGASGFVTKGTPAGALAQAIRRVHEGARYVDPELAAELLISPDCPLTERELEVLAALAEGGTPAAIARRVGLSAGTVRNYAAAIMTKLEVSDRAAAIQVAQHHGWI